MTIADQRGPKSTVAIWNLLASIDAHGSDWPSQFPEHGIEALAAALAREMAEGTVDGHGKLTDSGRETLARDEVGDRSTCDTATKHSLTSPPVQWR